ncbi:MAG: helix-turn-helix domain-containing protein [Rhizonema sp. PD38]|nr:helix-turn-helix domain-containing protein [Rhizonema sp. PD38]
MLLSSKTTLKLNQVQNSLLARHAGTARHAYNWVLGLCKQILKIVVSINLYLKHLANLFAGEVFEGVKTYKKYNKILAQLQCFHRHKHISSANLKKTQMATTRLTREIVNIRQDAGDRITTYVANNSGIRVEVCRSSRMTNHCKRVKAIANLCFGQCRIRSSKFVVLDKFDPSHKTCCQVESSEKILFFVRANLLLPTVWY